MGVGLVHDERHAEVAARVAVPDRERGWRHELAVGDWEAEAEELLERPVGGMCSRVGHEAQRQALVAQLLEGFPRSGDGKS